MALVLLTEPTPTSPPSSAADWGYAMAKQTAALQAFTGRSIVDGSTIHAGTVILVGNALYKSTTDTTITGSASIYVKITPSGASATASFVSSLSGVSWDFVTGQYVDGSGNVYLFDEARAINEGVLSTARTMQGQTSYISGALNLGGPLLGVDYISMGGSLSGVTNISMNGVMNGAGSFNTERYTNSDFIHNLEGPSSVGETTIFRIVTGPTTIKLPATSGRTYDYFGFAMAASDMLVGVLHGLSEVPDHTVWSTSDVAGGQFYLICTRTT